MDQFFILINQWMNGGLAIAVTGAFAWGMISVLFSPCHLASIPLIVAYVAGQKEAVNPKRAIWYAGAFTTGLFTTIAMVGIACALLGRMLGDIGTWWQALVGALLIWVALGIFGVKACTIPGSSLSRFQLRGMIGSLALGLAYGFLSGTCTFAFIAPILAIITINQQIFDGSIMMLAFAIGHCIPIMIAGSSVAMARRFTQNNSLLELGIWFRRMAGTVISMLGIYYISGTIFS